MPTYDDYDGVYFSIQAIRLYNPEIIDDIEFARFDRATFKSFGDSSLIFELVYYVQVPDNDYNEFMNIQQKINFEIFKKFEQQQIEFAYPTQTLHISKD